MAQYESNIKYIPYSQERVYEKLSDLNNLSDMGGKLEEMKEQLQGKIEDFSFDQDSISVKIQGFNLTMKIIERNPSKEIKFEGVNTPIPMNLWVQILPHQTAEQSKMKLTIRADVNMFMKSMVAKPLQEGVEKLADLLAMIKY
ncbi:MAG: SRPBCC family protein [Phocaeicola sp.]|uniref:SRPBCC family protein n=1 Tax=Phocaeicola sp. TaxID=2773926 RepID=UPI003FA142DD